MNMNRRRFLCQSMLLGGGLMLGAGAGACSAQPATGAASGAGGTQARPSGWLMPDEDAPHIRTWMAFGASQKIWGRKLLPEVRRNLALIANTIAEFEPVHMLVRPEEEAIARKLVSDKVRLIPAGLDDLWMRDTGCVFVKNAAGERAGVNFNFNGWGGKQASGQDAKVAALVAKEAGVPLLSTDWVLEGGCIEVNGHGLAVMTESCILNDNRNPGRSKDEFAAAIQPLLGIEKIIWLPGVKGRDITDGHIDFYARFAGKNTVLAGLDNDPSSYDYDITRRHLQLLQAATNLQGQPLQVETLTAPTDLRPDYLNDEFAAGYIGFYVCNGAVIAQEFGDAKADAAAKAVLQQAYPGREVIMLNVDGIAAGGGSIHCTTQQEIA